MTEQDSCSYGWRMTFVVVAEGCDLSKIKIAAFDSYHIRGQLLRGYPPNFVAHIIGHQQVPLFVDHHAHWPAHGVAVSIQKTGEYVDWHASRLAVGKGYEDHFVTAVRFSIP